MMSKMRDLLSVAALALVARGPSGPQRLTVGAQLQEFKLKSLAGEEVESSSLAGSTVVVNSWATSCQPCLRESQHLPRPRQASRHRRGSEEDRASGMKLARHNSCADLATIEPTA